jgi:hypothetical protein
MGSERKIFWISMRSQVVRFDGIVGAAERGNHTGAKGASMC